MFDLILKIEKSNRYLFQGEKEVYQRRTEKKFTIVQLLSLCVS